MPELIAIIILFGSLLGIGVILVRRIPTLKELKIPEKAEASFFSKIKGKIKKISLFKADWQNIFLQKLLSKIKVLSLRIETKTSQLLQKIREKARKRKEDEKYWEKISKFSLREKRGEK